MKIEYIEFADTRYLSCGWVTLEELKELEPSPCYAVGFVTEETDEKIILAMCHNTNDAIQGFAIPKGAIVKRIVLNDKDIL